MNNNFSDIHRVNQIWRHPVYQEHYKKIQELESERIFCRHTPEHFLDVARLMYIYALEEHLELPKELIYAAALLHDIGRAQQYQYNIRHDIAGVEIAREILTDLHFTEQEKELILSSKEGALLLMFMKHPQQVFTKDMIYEHVWGNTVAVDDNAIMVYINRLRGKIEDDRQNPAYILTIRGLGYRFVP